MERWARERYLASLNVAPTTDASYRFDLDNYVIPNVGNVELAKLTAEHVDDLDAKLAARGMSLATRRHARGALSRVLRHAKRKGYVADVMTVDADRLAKDDRDRTRGALEGVQVRALLAATKGTEWELPIALLGMLGLRRAEVLGLGWDCTDLPNGTLHIGRAMVYPDGQPLLDTPKTAKSVRTLGLTPPLVALLRAHRARQHAWRLAAGDAWQPPILGRDGQPVALMFTDEAGRPLSPWRLGGAVERYGKTAGLGHVHPHLLRHSVASVAIAEGHDVAAVSAMLGHANPNVTLAVYTHAFDRTMAAATATVANAVGAW